MYQISRGVFGLNYDIDNLNLLIIFIDLAVTLEILVNKQLPENIPGLSTYSSLTPPPTHTHTQHNLNVSPLPEALNRIVIL